VTGQSEGSLISAAQMLGCDKDELRKSLVCRAMQATKGGRAGTLIQYDCVHSSGRLAPLLYALQLMAQTERWSWQMLHQSKTL